MIDFDNLQPLPTRRHREREGRERLAEAAHRKRCATHKGRNHWRNWERRQMEAAKKRAAAILNAKKMSASEKYREHVRSYWSGLRADHP